MKRSPTKVNAMTAGKEIIAKYAKLRKEKPVSDEARAHRERQALTVHPRYARRQERGGLIYFLLPTSQSEGTTYVQSAPRKPWRRTQKKKKVPKGPKG